VIGFEVGFLVGMLLVGLDVMAAALGLLVGWVVGMLVWLDVSKEITSSFAAFPILNDSRVLLEASRSVTFEFDSRCLQPVRSLEIRQSFLL
jgi:hypothetical protein